MRWRRWGADTAERVVSTSAGAALTAWCISTDWRLIGGFAGAMGTYTVFKCVAALPFGDKDSASFVKLEEVR